MFWRQLLLLLNKGVCVNEGVCAHAGVCAHVSVCAGENREAFAEESAVVVVAVLGREADVSVGENEKFVFFLHDVCCMSSSYPFHS